MSAFGEDIDMFEVPRDYEKLFGADAAMVQTQDREFFDTFMGTFLQRVDGAPPLPAGSSPPPEMKEKFNDMPPEVKRVALPLVVKGTIVCLPTGIPSGGANNNNRNVRLPSNARSTKYQQDLKFPTGGIHLLMGADMTFMSKLCKYVVEGQKPQMLAKTNNKCACCGKYAGGFVCTTKFERPGSDSQNKMQATINFRKAFPACKDTGCNRKLRDYVGQLENITEDSVMVTCEHCRKAEDPGGKKFPQCSRCKMRYYCSKECQKADWAMHRKMCVAPKKN